MHSKPHLREGRRGARVLRPFQLILCTQNGWIGTLGTKHVVNKISHADAALQHGVGLHLHRALFSSLDKANSECLTNIARGKKFVIQHNNG